VDSTVAGLVLAVEVKEVMRVGWVESEHEGILLQEAGVVVEVAEHAVLLPALNDLLHSLRSDGSEDPEALHQVAIVFGAA
jgi:hypothetical protein